MGKTANIGIVVGLAAMVVLVIALKDKGDPNANDGKVGSDGKGGNVQQTESKGTEPAAKVPAKVTGPLKVEAPVTKSLPRLVDLGADKCIPCKKMAPILENLKEEYAGRFEVVFIDVWKNPDAGTEYGVKIIPTQIFYDTAGKELFRHVGFFSKEDILGKWKELGVELGSKGPASGQATEG